MVFPSSFFANINVIPLTDQVVRSFPIVPNAVVLNRIVTGVLITASWQKIKGMDCQFNLFQIAKVPLEMHVKFEVL
jgi:hypothetical protein